MKDLVHQIAKSKYFKFLAPLMIVLIVGIYLSFSNTAVGGQSTISENPVKSEATVTNKEKSLTENSKTEEIDLAVPTEEVNLPKTESTSEETVASSAELLQKNSMENVEPEGVLEKITSTQTPSIIAQITQPASRGTSPQKQTVVKSPVEKAPEVKTPPVQETKTETPKTEEPKTSPEIPQQPVTKEEPKESPAVNPALFNQDLNSYILDIIKTYEIGKYPYLLNTDYKNYNGVTTNIVYKGSTIAKANPNGDRASHCVGITFEVFFKAMQERNQRLGISSDDFNGMTAEDLRNFMLNWFVADGIKPQQNCSVAIEKYGIGKRIYNLGDAKPGDFIDISRENYTGHTAVFLNWIKKDGKIIGLKYWGSQSSTNGIAYKEEYFNVTDENGNKYGNVMFDQIYIGRVGAVNDYKSFR